MTKRTHKFRGFDDYVEVFRAGTHTDASGKTSTFTEADLDQMVANHTGVHTAPAVVGHPKADTPAYGWADHFKRDGELLLAKFSQVEPAFSQMVSDGRFPNRSIKVVKNDAGWQVKHVGFLGGVPPAIEGLKPLAFSSDDPGATFEFSYTDSYATSLVVSGFRRLREFIIAKFNQETADEYLANDLIDNLASAANSQSAQAAEELQSSRFNAPLNPEPPMKTYTQEQLDAALNAERAKTATAEGQVAQFNAQKRTADAQEVVDKAVTEGRLTPAQAVGMPEFMASLDGTAEFTFASEGVESKQKAFDYFKGLLEKLPKQLEFNRQIVTGDHRVDTSNSDAIVTAAKEYQAAEKDKGRTVEWHEAVTHITQNKAK